MCPRSPARRSAGCEATRGTTQTGPTRTGISLPPVSWRPPSSKACSAASTPPSTRSTCRTRANAGYVPSLPEGAVVEVPARADASGLHPASMAPLPEGILGLLRIQTSINRLLVDAFASGRRQTLLQALLLDPTTHSYRAAVHTIDEMFRLQQDVLPRMEW